MQIFKLPFLLFLLFISVTKSVEVRADNTFFEISGFVKNSKNRKAIPNAGVSIPGSNIGTVTNEDGYFSIKIPEDLKPNGIKFDQIGYQSLLIPWPNEKNLNEDFIVFIQPTGKVLKEVLVLGGDPKEIVRQAINKIPQNYPGNDNLFNGFYRETVKKGNRYISVSEALVDVLKKPYTSQRSSSGEKVRIHRGRSLMSPRPSDTLAVKIMGGPYMPILLDAVKNGDHLFTIDEIDYFDFNMETGTSINDKMHYAISFKPKVSFSYPLNSGTFYIDSETLSISRVEFELDMKDKNKVTRAILQKRPNGLNFKPQEVSGVVTYSYSNGKSYINYICSRIRFKCDWKKRLFSSGYTTVSEMVMVDRNDNPGKNIKFEDSFGSRKIFSDIVENYWEEDFWKDYNIIEPSETLEKAVGKLKKSIKNS